MTILFFTRRFYPLLGGVEKHVFEISKRLSISGHRVIVVTENQGSDEETELLPIKGSSRGIEIKRIKVGNDGRMKKLRIWKELWKNRMLIQNADIIHCHDVFFWYLPFRYLYPKKSVYITFHGYETVFPPTKKAILVRKLSEKLASGNIIVGDFIKKWYGTKPSFIIYGGVENNFQKEKIKELGKKMNIIFVGRLEQDTGVTVYLNSLKLLKKNKKHFSFAAYGDGSLKNKVKKLGEVHGFVQNISTRMHKADVVFCSSYLTMLEALLMKKVVIALYENDLKKDYLKMSPFARYVYICKDEQEIVSVLDSLQKEPWRSNSMKENGARWANEQTWEKVISIYYKLWKRSLL